MKSLLSRFIRSLLLLVPSLALACSGSGAEKPLAVLVEGTGTYTRPIGTDSELAQHFFDQGLRLTWGFYFPEAAASFQEAMRHDPDNPMIYWGLALAISPNPNSRYRGYPDDPLGEGKRAIERAQQLASSASEKDHAFIDSLFVRYDDDAYPDRNDRDEAYLHRAKDLAERYPDDADAATLYADAVMILSPWSYWDAQGSPLPHTHDTEETLERIMERHPDHPGANHLYIHLLEASPHPERALPEADRLEALMPRAGHIVHMPSHVYVRVGRYDDAIAANERSIEADRVFLDVWGDRPFPEFTSHKLSARLHPWHANDFIRYAATVQGNYERALETARSAAAVSVASRTMSDGRTQQAVATIWLVHKIFGKWDELLQESPPEAGHPYVSGLIDYARGSAQVGQGNLEAARQELDRLEAEGRSAGARMAGLVNSPETLLRIAALGLRGEIAHANGDLDTAVEVFEQAVVLEGSLRYIEPPEWQQPMRHYLGAALLAAKRPEEAERIYREDMTWNRNNGWALFGLWQSLRDQGRMTEAEEMHARFAEAWRGADVTLEASRF